MLLDGVWEVAEEAFGDEGGGHAEAAGAGRFHDAADIVDFVLPSCEFEIGTVVESFGESLGADAAGKAFAAGLVGEEGHRLVGGADHVAAVVEDDDAAGAEEGAVAADAGFVEGDLEVVAGEEATAEAGHGDCLNGAALEWSAGPVVEEGLKGEAEGDLVVARALDVAGEGDNLCARVVIEAEAAIPFGTFSGNL